MANPTNYNSQSGLEDVSFLLLQDGTFFLLLQNGVDKLILEAGAKIATNYSLTSLNPTNFSIPANS